MIYQDKYLKYKTKYLLLKSQLELKQICGNKPLITNINKINLFIEKEKK
jgi:hypothetical protein